MPINKFGISLGRGETQLNYQCSGLVRNYVRDNALCMVAANFDAKSRKIRRVAQPEADDDAVNKLYVDQCFKMSSNQQKALDEKLTAFEKDLQALRIAIHELRH